MGSTGISPIPMKSALKILIFKADFCIVIIMALDFEILANNAF